MKILFFIIIFIVYFLYNNFKENMVATTNNLTKKNKDELNIINNYFDSLNKTLTYEENNSNHYNVIDKNCPNKNQECYLACIDKNYKFNSRCYNECQKTSYIC